MRGKGFLRFRTEAEGALVCLVADLGEKEALLAADPDVYSTTPHYDGHASVLVDLVRIAADELAEMITESWLQKAPPTLARQLRAAGGPEG